MAAAASDKYFWLSYCQAIQQAVGAQPGDSSAVFFTTKAQKGPLASPLIPPEYSNYGIYNIADNLLAANNLFYVPSIQNSYIRSLQDYLGYVDLGGSGNEAVITRVVMTKQALDAAMINARTELGKAYKDFQEQQSFGMTGNLTFAQWWPQNAPAYANAVQQQDAAAAANQSAINDMNGPLAAQYQIDTKRITQAMTSNVEVPGIAMSASAATPDSAQEILNAVNSGKQVSEAKGIYYVPAYNSPEYVNTVKNWIGDPSRGREGNNKINIQISKGKNVDESSFGQTSVGGGLSFSYCPWVSFGVSGSSSEEEQLNNGQYTDNDVSITLTYDEIRAVPVNPGLWNIGNPKKSYPKLKPGAPVTAQILVAPTQLILVKNLGYRIRFSNSLRTTFDKKVKSTQQGGGYVRVFGIPIQIGGSFTKTNESTTHVATWDSDSGEFVVAPTDEGAFASIVAIQGDKIKTT